MGGGGRRGGGGGKVAGRRSEGGITTTDWFTKNARATNTNSPVYQRLPKTALCVDSLSLNPLYRLSPPPTHTPPPLPPPPPTSLHPAPPAPKPPRRHHTLFLHFKGDCCQRMRRDAGRCYQSGKLCSLIIWTPLGGLESARLFQRDGTELWRRLCTL